jgi:hypothetical protein
MNLLVKKTGLLLILGALFFFSCKDSSEILLDTEETDKIHTSLLDTFSISSSTVLLDSFVTIPRNSGEDYMVFGSLQHPNLGLVEATSIVEVGRASVSLPADAKYFSFELLLDLQYKPTTVPSKFNIFVYSLSEPIDTTGVDSSYYKFNSPEPAHGSQINVQTEIDPTDTGLVHVKLDDQLGQLFFDSLKLDSEFKNQLYFHNFFHGIKIKGDNSGSAILGAARITSALQVTYTNPADSTVKTVLFPLSSPYHYNLFKEPGRTSLTSYADKTFVQSGTGVLTKVSFPSVKNLKSLYPQIAINKAELIIEPETNLLTPPSSLFLLRSSQNGDIIKDDTLFFTAQNSIYADAQFLNRSALYVSYDTDKKLYNADVTSYVEAYLKSSSSDIPLDLILYPEAKGTFIYEKFSFSFDQTTGRLISGKDLTINFAVIPKNKIKLKVYYTLVD